MRLPAIGLLIAICTIAATVGISGDSAPKTGPATEQRFPPLQLPPGFKATLFACDPFIEYPSVIAAGPKANQLFVAIDYMTGLGVEIVRRDEIRLIEDTDGDGYADKSTVFATGFNSIQGLACHDGIVYVMHAPNLTALRDSKGAGKADERKDVLVGLGLKPEDNPSRLHCANGVVVGHDGWLYLALGDNGCNILRPEGDRLIFNGGGVLRCRVASPPSPPLRGRGAGGEGDSFGNAGHDLHIFSTGLRNIYDIALDDELNVFVRDNENDGGDYKIRVCHSFFGADHGYPYNYYEHPDEALPPLADLGLGSSAGIVCYRETAFPKEYRGSLFACEWGKSLVNYKLSRQGSGFAPVKEEEFASGSPKDPYGFKPTDVVVQRDGALMVSDWCDGQRPKRGRGRIYRITNGIHREPVRSEYSNIAKFESESYFVRGDAQTALMKAGNAGVALRYALAKSDSNMRAKIQAIWTLVGTQAEQDRVVNDLLTVARFDREPQVRAQAVRAIADLSDPILTMHKLSAGHGSDALAAQLTALPTERDPRVLLEIIIALGRLHWANAPTWLAAHVTQLDEALAHASIHTLRQCDNWPAVLKLLDHADERPMRTIALRAVADQVEPVVVDGLIDRLAKEKDSIRRRQYADALTRVAKKPGAWKYWGYRPAPRTPNTVAWERTEAIEKALDHTLADADRNVRFAILQRMQRENIPMRLPTLLAWLREDTESTHIAAILTSLREHPAAAMRDALESLVADKNQTPANRQAALALWEKGLGDTDAARLLTMAKSLSGGPILAEALRLIGNHPKLDAAPLLLSNLVAPEAAVRAAAAEASGKLGVRPATPALLKLTNDADASVRRASFVALRQLKESGAVKSAVAALKDSATQLAALQYLSDFAGLEHAKAVGEVMRHQPSAEIVPLVLSMVSKWSRAAAKPKQFELERELAALQGASGIIGRWRILGPMPSKEAEPLIKHLCDAKTAHDSMLSPAEWDTVIGAGLETRVRTKSTKSIGADEVVLAISEVELTEASAVQFLGGSSGAFKIWLDGQFIHQQASARAYAADADRFDANLSSGLHRIVVQVAPVKGQAEFHLRFRRKSSAANHEQLMQAALSKAGNADRGRKLFLDVNKTQCLKCHRHGEQGEKIGPDLTGVGGRFSRVYLIESILEPNRTIAPSYETLNIQLKDGRALLGVRVAENADSLTIGDNQGKKHVLMRSDIDEMRRMPASTMPEGLERPLSTDEFVDLVAFLASQKQ